MTPRPFLIDTDTGSDDAVALVMALRNPGISVEAITMVAGNVPVEQGTQNALYVAELCGKKPPVHVGADRPLKRALRTAQFVHGNDGMGDIGLPLSGRAPTDHNAVNAIISTIDRHVGEITVVTLGPLTNIALALQREPALATKVKSCVVMGGTGQGPGNVTPVAEFNLWVDPEAAKIVFDSELPIRMVGWDISVAHAVFDANQSAELRAIGGPLAEMCVDIQRVLDKFAIEALGIAGFDLPDPIAMAIAIDPSIATEVKRLHVEVETESELCRGQTVVDHYGVTGRDPNLEVVLDASRERFVAMLHDAVRS